MSRHREFDHLRPKSAIKRRDGLHDFSRSLFVLSPRLVAAKKGIENRRLASFEIC
jgi:hypothetical protein